MSRSLHWGVNCAFGRAAYSLSRPSWDVPSGSLCRLIPKLAKLSWTTRGPLCSGYVWRCSVCTCFVCRLWVLLWLGWPLGWERLEEDDHVVIFTILPTLPTNTHTHSHTQKQEGGGHQLTRRVNGAKRPPLRGPLWGKGARSVILKQPKANFGG